LRRRLKGEIDNILAMALRKEPERRYASVDQFSDDIRRHLENLPVVARNDTFGYRTLKFIGRHKIGVSLGVAAILALVTSTGFALWQAQQLSQRLAEDQRLATSFLADIHDAIVKLPGATPVREALLEQSLRYLNGLATEAGANDPSLQRALALAYERTADLQAGTSGAGLAKETDALETAQKALAIRERLAAVNPDNRQMQLELANTYLLAGFLVARTRSLDKRLEYDSKAQEIARELVRSDPENPAYLHLLERSHMSLAYSMVYVDRWEEARSYLRTALEIHKKLTSAGRQGPGGRQDLARIHYRIGTSYAQSGQPAQALEPLRQALAIQNSIAQDEPQNTQLRFELAATHHFLGISVGKLGHREEAIRHLDQAIAIRTAVMARDPRDARSRAMLAGNYSERAMVLLESGDRMGALDNMGRALGLQESVYEVDPAAVPTRISLAEMSGRLGDVYASLAEAPGRTALQRADSWRQASRAYARATQFYTELRRQGHIRSPIVIADIERVRIAGERAALREGEMQRAPKAGPRQGRNEPRA
jgi:tetratricopeptide (TPR) repeat protein